MYKFILFIFFSLLLCCSCRQDDDFKAFHKSLLKIMEEEPLMRAIAEDRLFLDSFVVIPKKEEVQRILLLSKEQLKKFHTFEIKRLNPDLHEQYQHSYDLLEQVVNKIEVKKTFQTMPALYSVTAYLKFLSKGKNIEKLGKGLDQSRVLFQTAIHNLDPVISENLEGTISESIAAFEFLTNEMSTHIKQLEVGKEEKIVVLTKLNKVKLELKNFIAFCNSKLFDLREEK